jgi:hypothetical protein
VGRRMGTLTTVLVVGALLVAALPAAAQPARGADGRPLDQLERVVLDAVRDAAFDQVVDLDVGRTQVAASPNVDVAVLELNPAGQVVAAANVLLSRDAPDGYVVPIDQRSLSSDAVRFTAWSQSRWNAGGLDWDAPFAPSDVLVPGTEDAPFTFMVPYPASTFKIIVAYHVLTLVDDGLVALDDEVTYVPSGQTRTVATWLDEMITVSSNRATEALLALLHDLDEVDRMNAEMARLGMPTLQITGTQPVTGRPWNPGAIHMGALDTAKLFLLIRGGPGVLWRTDDGTVVRGDELSASSRAVLLGLLEEQGLKEVLSTTLLCGGPEVEVGLRAALSPRWFDPETGFGDVDGVPFVGDYDVRPCNAEADVRFLHKTGLTLNHGSDAGIVESLAGVRQRQYVIAVFGNLGYRFTDAPLATQFGNPCFDADICYTQRLPRLARTIDDALPTRGSSR